MTRVQKSIGLYITDIATQLFLIGLMVINWSTPYFNLLSKSSDGNTFIYQIAPTFYIPLIIIIVLGITQCIILKYTKTTWNGIAEETFDETDERDQALKNTLHRKLIKIHGYFLVVLAGLIAFTPQVLIPSYAIGIAICTYLLIRDIALIVHLLKKQ